MYEFDFDITDTYVGMLLWSYRSWYRAIRKGYAADPVKVAVKAARKQAAIDEAAVEHVRWMASQTKKVAA